MSDTQIAAARLVEQALVHRRSTTTAPNWRFFQLLACQSSSCFASIVNRNENTNDQSPSHSASNRLRKWISAEHSSLQSRVQANNPQSRGHLGKPCPYRRLGLWNGAQYHRRRANDLVTNRPRYQRIPLLAGAVGVVAQGIPRWCIGLIARGFRVPGRSVPGRGICPGSSRWSPSDPEHERKHGTGRGVDRNFPGKVRRGQMNYTATPTSTSQRGTRGW